MWHIGKFITLSGDNSQDTSRNSFTGTQMKTLEVYKMLEVTVVGRRTATLGNVLLHITQCVYSAMCFTNCCVHANVLNVHTQVLKKLTSIAVLLCL